MKDDEDKVCSGQRMWHWLSNGVKGTLAAFMFSIVDLGLAGSMKDPDGDSQQERTSEGARWAIVITSPSSDQYA